MDEMSVNQLKNKIIGKKVDYIEKTLKEVKEGVDYFKAILDKGVD
jgi:hypothetical protein